MSRGIGRAEMHGMAAPDETKGNGGGDRRLADAALSHHHNEALSIRRQKIDQPIQGRKVADERSGDRGLDRRVLCRRRIQQ